jgi:HlyD family secretion protein
MKRLWLILSIIIIAAVGGYSLINGLPDSGDTEYQYASVTRGTVENAVSATGTLSPVTEVEVGTQVSGTIDSVFVDFNDLVKADQILAVLDTSLLQASVLDSEASLERAQAALEQAESDLKRNQSLFDRGMISEADLLPFQIARRTQLASVKSARAALQRARTNLDYAVIRSPIAGIVIGRSVESGQTVAASLSTPTLFVIAEDLSHMEILAEVDESDIGLIRDGQDVRFEVATYNDREFTGKVKQIRLQPQTVSNVVTYTAVVEAANDDGLLLPGMTASLDFITDSRADVLLVPNKALRFSPSDEIAQAFFEKRRTAGENRSASASGGAMPGAAGMRPGPDAMSDSTVTRGMVWYLDSLGNVAGAPLRTGLSDGVNTEVIGSPVLVEGMEVIVGTDGETAATTGTQRRGMGFGGPPRF